MNVNLHIDSIVLDGIGFESSQTLMLQQAVSSQLISILAEQGLAKASVDQARAIQVASNVSANTLGPQLATAIYTNISRSQFGLQSTGGGEQ